jgi:hypothetical protein
MVEEPKPVLLRDHYVPSTYTPTYEYLSEVPRPKQGIGFEKPDYTRILETGSINLLKKNTPTLLP